MTIRDMMINDVRNKLPKWLYEQIKVELVNDGDYGEWTACLRTIEVLSDNYWNLEEDKILDTLLDEFYPCMLNELRNIFDFKTFPTFENLVGIMSTAGWASAIKTTCAKLDLQYVMDYYESVDYELSDNFDNKLVDRIRFYIVCLPYRGV